jgi:hypothetical protein
MDTFGCSWATSFTDFIVVLCFPWTWVNPSLSFPTSSKSLADSLFKGKSLNKRSCQ